MRVHDNVIKWLENLFIVLGTLALIVAAWYILPADAADLEAKKVEKAHAATTAPAPVIASTSPFYIGVLGGGGFSSAESDITFLGTAQGPLKAYPTGLLAGGEFGARFNTGTFLLGLNVTALYDFSQGSVGTNAVSNGALAVVSSNPMQVASTKNGVLLMEGGEFGINLSTLMGYVPTSAQPGNWPVPVVVPTNLAPNLNLAAIGGVAQRWQTLCGIVPTGFDPITGAVTGMQDCASRIMNGPYIGGELTGMLSAQWEAKIKVAHIFWNSSFTPTTPVSAQVFSNTISAKDETVGLAGLSYHF